MVQRRLLFVFILGSSLLAGGAANRSFRQWTLDEAVKILTESPWARQETFTRLISGIGSGVRGEKEIYNTFFIRFLSARPVREAYARVLQIQQGYDDLSAGEQKEADAAINRLLELDVDRWIVLAVSFRSNDADMERQVRQYWRLQTTETMRNRAFLSTSRFSQVQVAAFYPPAEEAVGAKFVFPRTIAGDPVVSRQDKQITFELLGVPGAQPELRTTFAVSEMLSEGEFNF